jgi:vacuolar-type H+-ATPase subunit H
MHTPDYERNNTTNHVGIITGSFTALVTGAKTRDAISNSDVGPLTPDATLRERVQQYENAIADYQPLLPSQGTANDVQYNAARHRLDQMTHDDRHPELVREAASEAHTELASVNHSYKDTETKLLDARRHRRLEHATETVDAATNAYQDTLAAAQRTDDTYEMLGATGAAVTAGLLAGTTAYLLTK